MLRGNELGFRQPAQEDFSCFKLKRIITEATRGQVQQGGYDPAERNVRENRCSWNRPE